MKCVIVAAGASTRLRPLTDRLPKCLLPVGKQTILQRTIQSILEADIDTTALVVGFEASQIQSYLRERFPTVRFRLIVNPNYESTNNAYSLLLAREFFLKRGPKTRLKDDLLVLDSDIVFDPAIIRLLIAKRDEDRIAVRFSGDHNAEEIIVETDDRECVVRIGKGIPIKESCGESIGIEYFRYETAKALFDILERRVRYGNGRTEFYESAFQELIDRGFRLKAESIGEKTALEIDTMADLESARAIVVSTEAKSDVRI